MTRLEDRTTLIEQITEARAGGARLAQTCALAGIDPRTVQRWRKHDGTTSGDRRPDAIRPTPSHALTAEERAQIVAVANEPRFAEIPPARIVPMLADEGIYIASESSFHRVLRAHGQMNRRGRASPPRPSRPPTTHVAAAPGQVWCWDITFLPAPVKGQWFYLYLILDLYSRKIVGFEVHDTDNADHAVNLVRRTALNEGLHGAPAKPVLHGDNGATLKATSVLAMLNWLGIAPSHSRPRVSNDNPYAEALFRTAKYRPEFPEHGFADLDTARDWAARFVHWYDHEHRHSAIRYVTPAERHAGADHAILSARHEVYQAASRKTPARWSRRTRNWTPIAAVTLNPERDATIAAASPANPLSGSAGVPAFPSRPENTKATARNAGQERSAAARSHAQRPLRREHGEDGEHRTLPGVSTVAPSASAGGTGRQRHDAATGGRE
jgi:transposase InsO family protein